MLLSRLPTSWAEIALTDKRDARKLIAMLNRCSYIVNADPTAEKIALLAQLLNQVCEHLEASGLVDR
jgi:hypothetical protein